jgi:hypothetical protein
MKSYGKSPMQRHKCLTSSLDGDECPAARPECFIPGVRAPGAHLIGGEELQNRSGHGGGNNNCLPLPGIESLMVGYPARSGQ